MLAEILKRRDRVEEFVSKTQRTGQLVPELYDDAETRAEVWYVKALAFVLMHNVDQLIGFLSETLRDSRFASFVRESHSEEDNDIVNLLASELATSHGKMQFNLAEILAHFVLEMADDETKADEERMEIL